jgi:hypothetical protein
MANTISDEEIYQKCAFVWVMGKNEIGQLGIRNRKNQHLPVYLPGMPNTPCIGLSASDDTTSVVTPGKKLYVAGSNLHSRLGLENLDKTEKISFNKV